MPVYDYLCGRCGAFTAMPNGWNATNSGLRTCSEPGAPDRTLFLRDAGGAAPRARDQ